MSYKTQLEDNYVGYIKHQEEIESQYSLTSIKQSLPAMTGMFMLLGYQGPTTFSELKKSCSVINEYENSIKKYWDWKECKYLINSKSPNI